MYGVFLQLVLSTHCTCFGGIIYSVKDVCAIFWFGVDYAAFCDIFVYFERFHLFAS